MSAQRVSILLAVFYLILTLLSIDHVFFGDMVQFGSRHAHFFYETNFSTFWLPNHLDSGHPPLFGMYIAFLWKLFGKSLAVSHLAMLPFLMVLAYAIPKTLELFVNRAWLLPCSLLIFFEPTLLSQSALTSPDIILISFFLLNIYYVVKKNYFKLSLFLIPMSFVSMRGMMVLFALFLGLFVFQMIVEKKLFHSQWKHLVYTFAPAAVISAAWLFAHYLQTGWIGFHSNSPWSSSFETVGIAAVIKNLMLMLWRFVDFGRISLWIVLIYFLIKFYKQLDRFSYRLISVFTSLILVFSINTSFADGLVGHRYYMPVYLLGILICIGLIQSEKHFSKLIILVFSSFIIGSFMVYPPTIAMGWDATPAHFNYYSLRDNLLKFIQKNNIEINNVAAGFPNIDSQEILSLNGDTSRFQSYHLKNTDYILWSNVFNYPDELITEIQNYELIYEEKKRGVFMRLYKIKKNDLQQSTIDY